MYWNEKVGLFWVWTLPKVPIVLTNVSNKNCIKLNFLQKSEWVHTRLYTPRSGAGGTKISHFWNNALEWESKFTLGLNVGKSTDYIEKYFNQKLSKIKFPAKTLLGAYVLSSPVVELRGSKNWPFLKYNAME